MSGTTAKATLQEKNVEAVTSTVTVEEAVATLDFTETKTSAPPSAKSTSTKAVESSLHRELPIFSNPLLANATQGNSVPIKAKTGRVKSGGKSVSVLRINAPKVDGDVVVMRRQDTDLINATSMFNAAYPAISEKMNTKERDFITRKYEGVFERSGALSGVWITISQAKELAKEYGIDQFMRPLLDMSSPKNASAVVDGEEIVEKTVVLDTLVQQQADMEDDQQILEETQDMEETTDKLQDLTVADVAGMKRRIEELEEQVSRDKKRLRGLVTVAVGFAAASVIPQVLPYFS